MFAYAQKDPIEKRYTPMKELGTGATAIVKKYKQLNTGEEYAVKTINKKEMNAKVLKREVDILLHLSHENIIKMYDVYESANHIHLVLELVTGGELFDRIIKVGSYSEVVAARALEQILKAVEYLHENGVIHRDLKPENILYSHEGDDAILKVADFGMSRILKPDQIEKMTCCGTPGYNYLTVKSLQQIFKAVEVANILEYGDRMIQLAPEVLLGKAYDTVVDMWAVGVIAFIMLGGYEPFSSEEDSDDTQIYQRIIKCDYQFDDAFWGSISLSAKDVIAKLLELDPRKRLTAKNCLEHPWVKGLGAKDLHLEKCVKKIREFNARRKLKGGIYGVIGANAMLQAIKKLSV